LVALITTPASAQNAVAANHHRAHLGDIAAAI